MCVCVWSRCVRVRVGVCGVGRCVCVEWVGVCVRSG